MTKIYGITNCNTVQKARAWLDSHGVAYEFHDYKKLGINADHLKKWCAIFGWEKVLNRQGLMWRKAPEVEKAKVVDEQTAIEFMLKVPNSIKRPVIEHNNSTIIGYQEVEYQQLFL